MHSHNKEIQQKYVSSLEGTTFEKNVYLAIFDSYAHRKYIASPGSKLCQEKQALKQI